MIKYILFIIGNVLPLSLYAQDNLNEIIQQADNLIGEGKYKDALEILNPIEYDCYSTNEIQTVVSFNFVKATALCSQGDFVAALPNLIEVVKYDTGISLQAIESIGYIYLYDLDDKASAIKYFQKAIIRYNEAVQLSLFDMYDSDLECLARICYMLGTIYAIDGNMDLAKDCYKLLASLNSSNMTELMCELKKYLSN